MRTQTMVQLTEELVRRLDARAAAAGVSRSQLIRDAIRAFLDDDAYAEAVEEFRQAYRRQPDTLEERAIAHANARAMVADEPW